MKVVAITGPKGSGKTTAAITAGSPDRTLVIDTETSASDFIGSGIEFAHYGSIFEVMDEGVDLISAMAAESRKMPWVGDGIEGHDRRIFLWFMQTLNERLNGQIDTVVIDTIEPIERAMSVTVEQRKASFGWEKKAFGGMEVQGMRPLYKMLIEGIARRDVKTLVITSHLKSPWVKQGKESVPVIGKVTPGGRLRVLSQMSSLMVWLVPEKNPDHSPAALILKARLAKMQYSDEGWNVHGVLPRRMPSFTWNNVNHYMKHPADLSNPAQGEALSDDEWAMMSEVLTDKQMQLMIAGAEERLMLGQMSIPQQVRHYHDLGMSPVEIAEQLDLTPMKVRKFIEG